MMRSLIPILASSEITPEWAYRRRRLLMGSVAASSLLLTGCGRGDEPQVDPAQWQARLQAQNPFRSDEALTRYVDATNYNNFYEFGTAKDDPARHAHSLQTSPWTVQISGHAERTGRFAIEDLLKGAPVEDRIYRLRCVEGWSMVIPWQGIALGALLKSFAPSSQAHFVAFTTLAEPTQMPGIGYPALDWPYVEGLRIDEAMHPLCILATGMYGRALPNQNGAPLRLVVPWKYGFKSIKSIVRIEFTEYEPPTSWNQSQPSEYGFYSNVNPAVAHPRWSQKTERRLAGDSHRLFAKRIHTLPFNGYGEQVASLYSGMDLARNF